MQDARPVQRRKTKRERFLIVAERRTIRVLKAIQLLAKCANRASYQYSEEDIAKVFEAIDAELQRTKAAFTRNRGVTFTLAHHDDEADDPPEDPSENLNS